MRIHFIKFVIIFASFLGLGSARADVWETQRPWDDAADEAFSRWIKSVPLDIFTSASSPYRGIPTDCAKAVYALRVIFAYENGLPVHFTSVREVRLANDNKQFDQVPAGLARLSKFIAFVRAHVDTRTLVNDTYPIKITRGAVRAGALFLHPQTSGAPITYRAGHVYYIQNVFENGMVRYFSSTVPSAVRDLQPRVDITFAPFGKSGGFRAWNRPNSSAKPDFDAQDQFQLGGWRPNGWYDGALWVRWSRAIRRRLQLRAATAEEEFKAKLENVDGYIKERTQLVARSWKMYQQKYHGRGCTNAGDYDSFSTPTRDVKIQNELIDLRAAAIPYLRDGGGSSLEELFANYRWKVLPGVSVDLNHLWTTFETRVVLAISEPEHSPEVRWGLQSQEAWPCPQRAGQYRGSQPR